MGRSCGKILLTFCRQVRRTKCWDIRFRGSSVMESTRRWVWSIRCRKHQNKSSSCFTNQNKIIKTSKSTKNSTTRHSWQPAKSYQRKTCKTNHPWITNKSRPHNLRCSNLWQPNSWSIPMKVTWIFWRWRFITWLETRKILRRSCPGTWWGMGKCSRVILIW